MNGIRKITRPKERQGSKGTAGKDTKDVPKAEEPPGSLRRTLRARSQVIIYNFPDTEEEDPDDTKRPSEAQGYICVSADPRRAGVARGGETFQVSSPGKN